MIQLRNMTQDEYRRFKAYSIADYANDLMKSHGFHREQALKQSTEEFENMLPKGHETDGQFLLTIEDTQRRKAVGLIWFFYEMDHGTRQVWISDFLIHDGERRKGYATAALSEMERMAKTAGCTESALYVWDHNQAGCNLYQKCGYGIAAKKAGGSVMKKVL